MTAPLIGAYAAHGYADESTYGTPATITNWKRVRSAGLRRARVKEVTGELPGHGAVSGIMRHWFATQDVVRGTIDVPLCYDDSTLLLMKHALAKAFVTTGPVSTKYTHTGNMGLPSAFPTSFTCEEIKGRQASNVVSEVYSGLVAVRTTLHWSPGQLATMAMEVIGYSSGGRTTASTTPTFTNGSKVLFHQAGNFTWKSVNDKIRNLDIVIDQKLDLDTYLGSLSTQRPYPVGSPEVTWSVTRNYDEATAYGDYLDDDQGDAAITFTGAGDNTLVLTLHNAICTEAGDPVQNAGKVEQTLNFSGCPDDTDSGFSVVFTNSNSSATAN